MRAARHGARTRPRAPKPLPDSDAPGFADLRRDGRLTIRIPGEARGWQRTGSNVRKGEHGHFVTHYTRTPTREAQAHVAACALLQVGRILLSGPLALTIAVSTAPSASWSQKKRGAALAGEIHPTGKPDFDNIAKLIADALNKLVWLDDAQIVSSSFSKRYATEAGTVLVVRPIVNLI